MLESKNQLSVVIPCYNEAHTIRELIETVGAQSSVGEIIIVDDCSSDNSLEIILSIDDHRIKVLKHTVNLGKGRSVADGFKIVTLPYVVIQDADLEYDPTEYELLLKPILNERADVVFGSRFMSGRSKRVLYYWHSVGNSILTTLSNIFTNLDLSDMETCYKVMKREVAQSLVINENRFGIEPEMTAQIAAFRVRVYEVAISYYGRTYDEGKKITWKDGFSAIRCIIKYNLTARKKLYRKNFDGFLSKTG